MAVVAACATRGAHRRDTPAARTPCGAPVTIVQKVGAEVAWAPRWARLCLRVGMNLRFLVFIFPHKLLSYFGQLPFGFLRVLKVYVSYATNRLTIFSLRFGLCIATLGSKCWVRHTSGADLIF